jgi:hypothetical protein
LLRDISNNPIPGSNLTPLPDNLWVIRLARPPKDYQETKRIAAIQLDEAFKLSSSDQKSVPPHLSVWAEALTTPAEAYAFLVSNKPDSPNRLVIRLQVDEVRNLKSSVIQHQPYSRLLDILWIYLFEDLDQQIRDKRFGASGHSGITGLDENAGSGQLSNKERKLLRKDLGSQLADLAAQHHFLLEN